MLMCVCVCVCGGTRKAVTAASAALQQLDLCAFGVRLSARTRSCVQVRRCALRLRMRCHHNIAFYMVMVLVQYADGGCVLYVWCTPHAFLCRSSFLRKRGPSAYGRAQKWNVCAAASVTRARACTCVCFIVVLCVATAAMRPCSPCWQRPRIVYIHINAPRDEAAQLSCVARARLSISTGINMIVCSCVCALCIACECVCARARTQQDSQRAKNVFTWPAAISHE